MSRVRWRVLAAVTAGLMVASAALSGAADASSAAPASGGISGVKGDPQPELKPFKIAGVGSGGANVAIESNGAMVVAYAVGTANGAGKSVVCVLDRGASKCSSSVTLTPLDGDDLESAPVVFAPSPNHVVVVTGTCCDANPNGGDLVYTSTNGGRTFGAPVRVGETVGVTAAALIGSQIVFASGGHDGAQVESVPVSPAARRPRPRPRSPRSRTTSASAPTRAARWSLPSTTAARPTRRTSTTRRPGRTSTRTARTTESAASPMRT